MTYVLVIESESTGETTCNIKEIKYSHQESKNKVQYGEILDKCKNWVLIKQGLTSQSIKYLENHFAGLNLSYNNHKEYFEVDVQGILVLNILSNQGFKVISQSMAIEYTTVGGRSFKIQIIVWTLGKDM